MSEEDRGYQSDPSIAFMHYAIAVATKNSDDIPLWRYRLMLCENSDDIPLWRYRLMLCENSDDIPLWRYRLMLCGWLVSRTVAESPMPSEIRSAASEFVRAALAEQQGDGPAYERHRAKLGEYGWSMEAHES
jgi:hypothetical protein